MVSLEARTRQTNFGEWDNVRKGGEKELKAKPTKENPISKAETKEESVDSFKKLLKAKPEGNVEIRVYWPGRRGKIEESVALEHSKEMVKGEVFRKTPSVIKQIAMLSAEKGIPESISVKRVDRWDTGDLRGELIIATSLEEVKVKKANKANKARGFLKEGSIIRSYFLDDQVYMDVVLIAARELGPGYANMALQEIGYDLKKRTGWGLKKRISKK